MKTEKVTFKRFSATLKALGFVSRRTTLDGRIYVVFRHEPTDTLTVLPPLKPGDDVPIGSLIAARYLFPMRGVTTSEELERLLVGKSAKVA